MNPEEIIMSKGRLIVFSAPSGCGKGTMLAEILKDEHFYCSVSATTRAPREGETDGVSYHFLTKEKFEEQIASGGLLEYAQYCGNYYGTLKSEVDKNIAAGKDVILEIEVQGAIKIRELRPDALFIFVAPPSLGELDRRLRKRGTETDEVIAKRVGEAAKELSYAEKYDYIIVNDALEDAVDDFKAVIRAEKLKSEYAREILDEVRKNA
jgi:guanylate kinase